MTSGVYGPNTGCQEGAPNFIEAGVQAEARQDPGSELSTR